MKLRNMESLWPAIRLLIAILFISSACQPAPAFTGSEGFVPFAHQDDLWQINLDGQNGLQRLTENSILNWSAEENFSVASDYRRVFLSPNGRWAAFSRTGLDLVFIHTASSNNTKIAS